MKFSSTLARLMWRGGFAAAVTALALAACGGGTDVEDFRPNRILSFGDESSMLVADAAEPTATQSARKYGVNAFDTSDGAPASTIDCRNNPVWVQSLASTFGLTFGECRGDREAAQATGRVLAQLGAYAAAPAGAASASDVRRQLDAFLDGGGRFTNQDLVTVMAGQNDIVDAYLARGSASDDSLLEAMRERAKTLAETVNQVAAAGPAVIVVRIPNVGITPWGRAQGTAGADLLRRMTEAFNTSLQLNLINDGHLIGLVFGDIELRNMTEFPGSFGLTDVVQPVCTQAAQNPASAGQRPVDTPLLVNCTPNTLIAVPVAGTPASAASATASTFLWAGNLSMGPTAQSRIGILASDRAVNNPF